MSELVPLKYARMAISPFGFYRGAVPVMAADLAQLPRTGIEAQICGDAHVRNLGAYAGPDGKLIFDINDFDESIRAPWEWDVKRMAASLVLAGREARNSERTCKDAVLDFVRCYRDAMREFAGMPVLDLARYLVVRHLKVSPILSVLRKAERTTPNANLDRLTEVKNGRHVLRERTDPVLGVPVQFKVSSAESSKVLGALSQYLRTLSPERRHMFAQYRPADVAFRVVGTGSVGVRDYVVLMFGAAQDDPLFMQLKEEDASAYAPYLPENDAPLHNGQRVVEGAHRMLVQSDIFLGWTNIDDRNYLVRQLKDHKAGIDDEDLEGNGLLQYARVCGELLAKGHARSGDPCRLFGYLGNSDKLDRALVTFAVDYADQSTRDFELLLKALRTGKLPSMKAPRTAVGKKSTGNKTAVGTTSAQNKKTRSKKSQAKKARRV